MKIKNRAVRHTMLVKNYAVGFVLPRTGQNGFCFSFLPIFKP